MMEVNSNVEIIKLSVNGTEEGFDPNLALPEFPGDSGNGGGSGGSDVGGSDVGLGHRDYLGKAAGYVRKSGPGQELEASLETQTDGLLMWAETEAYYMPKEWIFPDVIPGVTTVRPGFSALEALLDRETVDVVVVHSPDRLGRDPMVLFQLMDRIVNRGVAIRFLHGPEADDSPEGRLMMYIMGYAADRERLLIAERTMRGKRAVAKSGRMPIGGGVARTYAYDYCEVTKTRSVNEAEAVVVRTIFEWYAGGWTLHRIAEELNRKGIPTKRGNKWHPLTVRNILKNTSYIGWDAYGKSRHRVVFDWKGTPAEKRRIDCRVKPEEEWIWMDTFSPRVVSDELWESVQHRLAMPVARRVQKDVYLVTGYTRCGNCNSPVCGGSRYGGRRRYRCRGTQKTSVRDKICNAPYMDADTLESAVWDGLVQALKDPAVLLRELDKYLDKGEGDIAEKIKEVQKKIRECRAKETRLVSLFGDGDIDQEVLRNQLGPVTELRKEHERSLGRLQQLRAAEGDAERVRELVEAKCRELSETLDGLDFDGKRALMGVLDLRVIAMIGKVSMTIVVGGNPTTTERTSA